MRWLWIVGLVGCGAEALHEGDREDVDVGTAADQPVTLGDEGTAAAVVSAPVVLADLRAGLVGEDVNDARELRATPILQMTDGQLTAGAGGYVLLQDWRELGPAGALGEAGLVSLGGGPELDLVVGVGLPGEPGALWVYLDATLESAEASVPDAVVWGPEGVGGVLALGSQGELYVRVAGVPGAVRIDQDSFAPDIDELAAYPLVDFDWDVVNQN